MKKLKISKEHAEQIIKDNIDYLFWADGTKINTNDIIEKFNIVRYNNTYNLQHVDLDYSIEDIIITGDEI